MPIDMVPLQVVAQPLVLVRQHVIGDDIGVDAVGWVVGDIQGFHHTIFVDLVVGFGVFLMVFVTCDGAIGGFVAPWVGRVDLLTQPLKAACYAPCHALYQLV